MSDTSKIVDMTGCSQAEAEAALLLHPTDLIAAMDSVLPKTTISGAKYIPAKPKIDTGMDEEQKARCEKGRWLQDKVSGVFSAAHSKILEQNLLESSQQTSHAVVENLPVSEPAVQPESAQGSPE